VAIGSLVLALLIGGASVPAPPSKVEGYRRAVVAVGAAREALASEYGAGAPALGVARARAMRAIVDDLLPPWSGTPWDLNGTSETPGEGAIACGYLVTTVLRDAGFNVPRARMAQAASETIVRSLAPPSEVARLTRGDRAKVIEHIRAKGPGLYVVGLDYHVGLVVFEGDRMDFCHSTVLPPGTALCEPAATAAAFSSTLHVVAPLLTDWTIHRWLTGERFPVWQR